MVLRFFFMVDVTVILLFILLFGLGCMMLCHVLMMLCIIMSSLLPCNFGFFSMVRGFVFMVGFVFMLVFMLFFILMELFNRPIGPLCMMCCHVIMMLGIFMSAFFPGNSC